LGHGERHIVEFDQALGLALAGFEVDSGVLTVVRESMAA
jgi:hypothetical protein